MATKSGLANTLRHPTLIVDDYAVKSNTLNVLTGF